MKKLRKSCRWVAAFISIILILVNCNTNTWALDSSMVNDTNSFKKVVEFESAKHFSLGRGNAIRKDLFNGYSGNGFVYLVSGWADVNFTVPSDGNYKITIVTNSDQYKENWLYLDKDSAGKLCTNAGSWTKTTNEYTLSKGQHKFGVSSDWGYVALDYVLIEKVDDAMQPTDPVSKGGFNVKGNKLYDGKGNEFVMRGVNIAHAWYTSETKTSIDAVARLGANTVRVVLADGTQWNKTTAEEVNNIISWCREKGLVCILEVHDHTGFDDPQRLYTAVNYWIGLKDVLNANKDYVIVNVANEWLGTWNKGDVWTNTYCTAIKKMRSAGIENAIMVDAAGYGQETSSLISNCTAVKNADVTGNIMFSIHMYSVAGANSTVVKSNIDRMLEKGVCTVIGEFGDYQNGGDVDEATIVNYSDEKKVGTVAWSWKGNGGQDVTLDLSNDWEGNNLTSWGKYVFFSEHGIQKTSKLAY
ncbi:cellulase family glycosylhydrolase [Clostridium sp. HBUAS56017]|uniref:cellulase family glycosylhydrolase n=1 Tax=Clostridium sp. HBUAS56017 TaxID=2571128 RepID=UPI001178A085|nr:cellulase family glycosylhydrolase [Clostridium sp. HBUAS56017]